MYLGKWTFCCFVWIWGEWVYVGCEML